MVYEMFKKSTRRAWQTFIIVIFSIFAGSILLEFLELTGVITSLGRDPMPLAKSSAFVILIFAVVLRGFYRWDIQDYIFGGILCELILLAIVGLLDGGFYSWFVPLGLSFAVPWFAGFILGDTIME